MNAKPFLILMLSLFLRSGSAETGPFGQQHEPAEKPSADAELVKTRPGKEEILEAMVSASKMTRRQRDFAMDRASKRNGDGTTPRSDFLYCLGAAFLGDINAQICLANAYEKGIGIVDDATDAYVWYSIALTGPITDSAVDKQVRAARQRMNSKLVQGYPSPTEDELDALVQKELSRMREFQEQLRVVPRK